MGFAAIFRSLLYEACGRILNPIYGSVGLLWSGSWQLCHAATEAVLSGMPITPIASASTSEASTPPLKAYDIRHVPREESPAAAAAVMAAAGGEVDRAKRIRSGGFKRPGARTKAQRHPALLLTAECCDEESNRSPSHQSSLSHQSELGAENAEGGGGDSKDTESNSMVSAETTATAAKQSQLLEADPECPAAAHREDRASAEPDSEVGLELTLGFKPVPRESHVMPVKKRRFDQGDGACRMELGL